MLITTNIRLGHAWFRAFNDLVPISGSHVDCSSHVSIESVFLKLPPDSPT